MSKSVGIVGGGLAGLTAALRLARKDFRVHLFEKNKTLGGKMNEVVQNGFRFDTGPSLLTMPFVADELFHYLGLNRKDHLNFVEIDPICKYFWEDGTEVTAHTHFERMRKSLETISAEDAQRYKDFLLYSKAIYNLTADVFLYTPVHEIGKLFNRSTLRKLMRIRKIDPFRTVHEAIGQYFSNPHIVQLFDRYATYNGSNPYQAPATLNIIPYVEYVLGSFYIEGGMYRLIEKLVSLAEQFKVNLQRETSIEQILYKNKKIQGLQLNGEKVNFDYVICNGDVVTSFSELIDGFPAQKRKLNRLEPSLSGIVFLWGIGKTHPLLEHHNIFFSSDYEKEFETLLGDKSIPDDPTIYVAITCKSDPQHAPQGKENWFVLCNMPYLNQNLKWTKAVMEIKSTVLKKLKTFNVDIEHQIEYEEVLTPEDFFQKYKSNKGSIYGISSNRRLTAFRRPANRSREINGLYFTGGSAHPGGGIPLVMLSGKLTSDLILEKEGLKT